MPNVGPLELVIVLIIALIVLGPKKLPEVGRSIGRGMREFRGALTADRDDEDEPADADHVEDHENRADSGRDSAASTKPTPG